MEIVASNISRAFGGTKALADVSITLRGGAIHALVGENGAGKSTLLKILGGAERLDAGAVTIDGEPYRPQSLNEAVARGVGLVFQELTINPSLTVAENIFAGQLRRFRRGGLMTEKALAPRPRSCSTVFQQMFPCGGRCPRSISANGNASRSPALCPLGRRPSSSTNRPRFSIIERSMWC